MRDYTIGLDIGTTSVGWVCIDHQYQILKYNNRQAIGVHEFEAAESAAGRRIKRGMRRRYNRRKKRLQLLQSIFIPHIKDDSFFSTSDSHHFWKNSNEFEKRTLSEVLKSLRMNPNKYPTIYHLRQDLIENKGKVDLRLIYLAIHNLVKYRGHFLQEGLSWSEATSTEGLSDQFSQLLSQYVEIEGLHPFEISGQQSPIVEKILLDRTSTKSEKVKSLNMLLDKQYEAFYKLVVGLDSPLVKLFANSDQVLTYKESKDKVNLNAENLDVIFDVLLEGESRLIEAVQPFYQQVLLYELLKGETYVAKAKVETFNQYSKDLNSLKKILDQVFGEKIYRSYFITRKNEQKKFKHTHDFNLLCELDKFNRQKQYEETFYKGLIKLIEDKVKVGEVPRKYQIELNEILQSLLKGKFLVKQKGIQNAGIPYQNSLYEVERILANQRVHHPLIADEWIEKIKQIIAFRIPYYIGPLISEEGQSSFGWLEKKTTGNITPWTFDEKVDKAKSAEAFILRMTNSCTYLKGEKVLAKNSVWYQRFEVLNELNVIQLRTPETKSHRKHRLTPEMKQWIVEHVFKQFKIVSTKKLLQELKKSPFAEELYDASSGELKEIYGTQKENGFSSSLSSYITLTSILGDIVEQDPFMVEELIYWLTVFEDKNILMCKINERYPSITESQRSQLVKLNYTGWGRLSRTLIDGLPMNKNGQSILDYMEDHSINFMEILKSHDFGMEKKIQEMNQSKIPETKNIRYQEIEELAGSPTLKRGVWRAVKIIEELVQVFGEPSNIVLEVAREDQMGKRTKSRKQRWEMLAKDILANDPHLKSFVEEVNRQSDDRFGDQRLWLYVTQQGKCLYTGKSLDINNLSMYEIDHILPKNFVKDDSFDNLALVLPKMNQIKNQVGQNKMPLEIIEAKNLYQIQSYWKRINEYNLISDQKFQRLMKPVFDDVDKDKFIARQLVETRQIIKHVRDLLNERFQHTEIHLIKAGMVSAFRKFSQIPKIRDYNNKHHAMDALFGASLIQSILNTYGKNFLAFDMSRKDRSKQWKKTSHNNKEFFLFKNFADLEIQSPVTRNNVSGVAYFQEIFYELPWQTTKMTQMGDGMFYKETIFSPKVKSAKYQSPKAEKFVHDEVKNHAIYCVKYTIMKKGKKVQGTKFVDLKVIEKHQFQSSSFVELAQYLMEKELKVPVLEAEIIRVIPKYQKVWIEEFPYYFISTSELHNARQFELSKSLMGKILKANNHTSLKILKEIFENIVVEVRRQYPIYHKASVNERIQKFVDQELLDFASFQQGFEEIKKAVAANAQRSDKFGSRISKKPKADEVSIGFESITGLKYRKLKRLLE